MKQLPWILLIYLSFMCSAQPVKCQESLRIGVLTNFDVRHGTVKVRSGKYVVQVDQSAVLELVVGQQVVWQFKQGWVEVLRRGVVLARGKSIFFLAKFPASALELQVNRASKVFRVYDDDMELYAKSYGVLCINEVDLEKYVAGVVEAETGRGQALEFYKVQATIARTYALANRNRFRSNGYNLNDLTDCQVYHGKRRFEPLIDSAVAQTRDLVLVDAELNLITAAYHSNSGGHTVASNHVWTQELPYLPARPDEFSDYGPHTHWTHTLATSHFLSYLNDTFNLDTSNDSVVQTVLSFNQSQRQLYLGNPQWKISLKKLRMDLNLQSTFFDIEVAGDSVKFCGKGFGHGIGLSQEGAMRMANLGITYRDILFYYYHNVHLVNRQLVQLLYED